MTSTSRELHLGINMLYGGSHAAAWRGPSATPLGAFDVDQWVKVAQIAERGKLDTIFLGDILTFFYPVDAGPPMAFDPTLLLSAIARETSRIGLIATVSTTYEVPFNVARRIASLDHISDGRAAWNVVTTMDPRSAANYSAAGPPPTEERYTRADEFVTVVRALWDSWEPDSLVGDQTDGVFADPEKVHPINHHGKYFDVQGPLTVPPSPQGQPVILQAGGSAAGLELAATHAEMIFAATASVEHAQAFTADIRRRLVAHGREPDSIRVLPGLVYTLGDTEQEARRRNQELDAFLGDQRRVWLAGQLGADPDDLNMDKPIPESLLDDRASQFSNGGRNVVVDLARRERLTVREVLSRVSGFHRQVVGTPEQLADAISDWYEVGAVDGFNLMPDEMVSGLEAFVENVVPLLQRRGIFRTDYAGTTLREHMGLPTPENQFAASPLAAAGAENHAAFWELA